MPHPKYFEDMTRTAGEGESEIVVHRPSRFTGSVVDMRVLVDDQERLRLGNGKSGTVVVPDGRHSIYANHPAAQDGAGRQRSVTVNAAGSRIVLEARYNSWDGDGLWASAPLTKYMEIPLDGSNVPPSNNNYDASPQKPVIASSGQNLPKIAVYVTGNVAEDEKKALGTRMLASLVNSGRYIAIERSNAFLAEIEKEHEKQRSGAIDDSQISELGRQFGVKFVCIADITPAYGDFQVSARIVDVETAVVVFMGESSGKLNSMADLSQVSDKVVENMFRGQSTPAPAPKPAPDAAARPAYPVIYETQNKNFTGGQRFGTWVLNWLIPGVGSLAVMQDWGGAATQWVLFGGGIICVANGIDTHTDYYGYTEPEPNALFFVGVGAILSNGIYNIVRSATYTKKMPKNMAFLENAGLNVAVLPDRDGNIKGYMLYSMEF
jgi:hypothetical protein